MSNTEAEEANQRRGPSREEIETLCILHAVGRRGCHTSDLPARFGLSPALADVLAEATAPLCAAGWLSVEDDRVATTDAGDRYLAERLAELGVG